MIVGGKDFVRTTDGVRALRALGQRRPAARLPAAPCGAWRHDALGSERYMPEYSRVRVLFVWRFYLGCLLHFYILGSVLFNPGVVGV